MTEKINKPVSLCVEECKENLINVVSESGLSPLLLDPITKWLYEYMHQMYLTQLDNERKSYENLLKQSNNDKGQ